MLSHFPSGDTIEAYSKAAVIGLNGEIEHASGIIHTLRFGNHYRDAVNAKSFLSFTKKRGPAGTSIQVPMMNKDDAGFRSHYITLEMHIEDAPAADESIVLLGGSDRSKGPPTHWQSLYGYSRKSPQTHTGIYPWCGVRFKPIGGPSEGF